MLQKLQHFDYQLLHLINTVCANNFFDSIMPVIRNKMTWIPLYVAMLIFLINKEKFQAWKFILVVVCAVSISNYFCSSVLKKIVARDRPCVVVDSSYPVRQVIPCSNGYSFPSSHASNHACLAILFAAILFKYYQKKFVWVAFLFWAALISFAQVYVGVHYPFDVAAGMFIGSVFGLLGYYLIKKKIV